MRVMTQRAALRQAAPPAPVDPATATRDQLVMEHLSLVKTLAQRLAQRLPSQVEVSDLVSVGVLGLIDAAARYKPTLGVPFDAFARRRVQGAMLDSLRDLDWAPRSLRRLRRDVDAAIAAARRRLGREPEESDIAAEMSLTQVEYERALEQLRTLEIGAVRSLDSVSEDGVSHIEVCVDPGDGASAQLERKELREHLARAIKQLPERERQILSLYFEEELTLAEIGQVIGVGESRVSQLRSLALSRLRVSLRESLGVGVCDDRSTRPLPQASLARTGTDSAFRAVGIKARSRGPD
jgi:RNA polymerase sigma factor for flagellar operon FliA